MLASDARYTTHRNRVFPERKKTNYHSDCGGLGRDAHVPSIEDRFMDMTGSGKVSPTGKNRAQLGEWGTLGEG